MTINRDVIEITLASPSELFDAGVDTIAHAFADDPATAWPKAMANATNLDAIAYNRVGFGVFFEYHRNYGSSTSISARSFVITDVAVEQFWLTPGKEAAVRYSNFEKQGIFLRSYSHTGSPIHPNPIPTSSKRTGEHGGNLACGPCSDAYELSISLSMNLECRWIDINTDIFMTTMNDHLSYCTRLVPGPDIRDKVMGNFLYKDYKNMHNESKWMFTSKQPRLIVRDYMNDLDSRRLVVAFKPELNQASPSHPH